MKRQSNKGFTIMELFIVVVIIIVVVGGVIGGGVGAIAMGNEWYMEDGVLRQLKFEHPSVVSIRTERHIFSYSVVYARNTDGSTTRYELDSDVLFNYRFLSPQ